jgi:hypothetical protein
VAAAKDNASLPPAPVPSPTTPSEADLKVARTKFLEAVRACFLYTQSVFINQYNYNQKDARMNQLSNERKTDASAQATIDYLVTELDDSTLPKTTGEVIESKVKKSSESIKRHVQSESDEGKAKMDSLEDQLKQERAKRQRLESKVKSLEKSNKSSIPNGNGGPAKGAHKTNCKNVTFSQEEENQEKKPSSARRRSRGRKGKQEQNEAEDATSDNESKQRRRSGGRSQKHRKLYGHKTWTNEHTEQP